ncbi:hypothetical protein TRFO_00997 [Tritrichomonas foetus]|uniref:Uncharacterized protein n=1 Tax=Tritrichomonas foetus TaxID=1144522 RepID=A0A1J4L2F4_9EUKA|nr:hypothetical protein TRFO_00997 [Tritrichomonas foetus]|eukprot:OHT17689.1 hypothetical protein TRFO_00997 [Tritrichomonas foetus]
MEDFELIEKLESSVHQDILHALETLFEREEKNAIDARAVIHYYNSLCPLLIHNHYKIRCYAFQHLLYFLQNCIVFILSTESVIPNIISTLVCCQTNEMIKSMVTSAQQCLIIIFDIEEPKLWWAQCQKVLHHSKSNLQRIRLLEVLVDHFDEIPVRPILSLLNDTVIQVQRYAYEIIQMMDPVVVERALRRSKQFLGIDLKKKPHPALKTPPKKRSMKKRERISEAERRRRLHEALRQLDEARKREALANKTLLQNRIYGEDSPVNYKTRISRNSSPLKTTTLLTLGTPMPEGSQYDMEYYANLAEEEKKAALNISNRNENSINADSNLTTSNLYVSDLNTSETTRVTFVNDCNGFSSSITTSPYASNAMGNSATPMFDRDFKAMPNTEPLRKFGMENGRMTPTKNLSHNMSSDAESLFDKLYPNEKSKYADTDDWFTDDEEEDIPALIPPKDTDKYANQTLKRSTIEVMEPFPIELIDMAEKSWQYRLQYLTEVYEALNNPEVQYEYRADYLLDCVLTAATPPNKRVAPILADTIAEIILSNPEIAHLFINDIVNFLLLAQRLFKPGSTVFVDLLDTLFIEVSPPTLIGAILDYPNLKSSHAEHLIRTAYLRKPGIRLNRLYLQKLISFLVYDAYPLATKLAKFDKVTSQPIHMDAVTDLFHLISFNQPKTFASVVQSHTLPAQKILKPFIINEEDKEYQKMVNKQEEEDVITNQRQAMAIVFEELRNPKKCNLSRLANALERTAIKSPKLRFNIFLKLLTTFSKLSEETVLQNDDFMRRICFSHFTSVKLLEVLNSDKITADYVAGMARFVWYCPSHLLTHADQYYPKLYQIYINATGPLRNSIVAICAAFQQSSQRTILDVDSIETPHRKVLERNINRYLKT